MISKNRWNELYADGRDFVRMNKFLLKDLLFVKSGKALDIGCGTGQMAKLLVDLGFDVLGVDLAEEAVKKARSRVPEAQFNVQDIEQDFPEEKFDLITCKLVFAFLEDKQKFFRNVSHHLNEGGQLLIATPVKIKGEEYSDHYNSISVREEDLETKALSLVTSEKVYDGENEVTYYQTYKLA